MRIDEIDLYGNLLISGSTGSEGQILTYGNDGGFAWGTASGGSSGPTSSYFKTSGYNYVICETVNNGVDPSADAIINGTNLINAYELAKLLDVGTKSATNRVVVLLMPGDYDLSSDQFQLDTSFVDLVGISSNPYNTILRSSAQAYTIQYTSVVDSALKNVYLKPGTSLGVYGGGYGGGAGSGSYLRWENLIISGYIFQYSSFIGFSDIYGEFYNIKVLDNSSSFVCSNILDGIFDNIEVGNNAYTFDSTIISGTFSNINSSSGCFTPVTLLSGYYENINILGGSGNLFCGGGSTNGTFKKIKIGGSFDNVFSTFTGDLSGTYENIEISDAVNAFYNEDYSIYGTYKNIEIYNLTNKVFFSSFTMSGVFEDIKIGGTSSQNVFFNGGVLLGSFKNIEIGDVSLDAFSPSSTIDGTFENITIGNVGDNAFKTTDYILGSFKNITIGDITNYNIFYAEGASGQILGTFDEIKIGNIASTTGYFFTSGATMGGTFSNIEIGDASEWATGSIYMFTSTSSGSITGSYKNIKVGNNAFLFHTATTGDLNGTFENIEFGESSGAFFLTSGSILGTYSNIKSFSPQQRVFSSTAADLIGTFENIEFPNSITSYTFFRTNSLSGTFRNIKLGDLSGINSDVFYSGATALSGTFENIEVGNGNGYDIFKTNSFGNIIGTFSNIKIGDDFGYAFNSGDSSGVISGNFKDITIGSNLSGIFYGTEISVGTTIDNLYSTSRFRGVILKGRLINSTIIDSVNTWELPIDVSVSPMPIIENCKLITNTSIGAGYSIGPVNGPVSNIQILYTATSEGFDTAGGDSLISPNFNITDAGLT